MTITYKALLHTLAADTQFERKLNKLETAESIRNILSDYFRNINIETAHEIALTNKSLSILVNRLTKKLAIKIRLLLKKQLFKDLYARLKGDNK